MNFQILNLRKDSSYLARYDITSSDQNMNLAVPAGDFFIVADTNILLSHLNFIQRLLKYGIACKLRDFYNFESLSPISVRRNSLTFDLKVLR